MKSIMLSCVVCALLASGLNTFGAAPEGNSKDAPAKKKEDAKNKPINATCPVQSGEAIDAAQTTAYKGKTVAFCCEDCITTFKKDPEKYMKQIAADNKKAEDAKKKEKDKGKGESPSAGKSAKAVNQFCVVHPEDAVDETVTTEYEGKVVGFCCEDCQKKFDLDPALYAAKLKK